MEVSTQVAAGNAQATPGKSMYKSPRVSASQAWAREEEEAPEGKRWKRRWDLAGPEGWMMSLNFVLSRWDSHSFESFHVSGSVEDKLVSHGLRNGPGKRWPWGSDRDTKEEPSLDLLGWQSSQDSQMQWTQQGRVRETETDGSCLTPSGYITFWPVTGFSSPPFTYNQFRIPQDNIEQVPVPPVEKASARTQSMVR